MKNVRWRVMLRCRCAWHASGRFQPYSRLWLSSQPECEESHRDYVRSLIDLLQVETGDAGFATWFEDTLIW